MREEFREITQKIFEEKDEGKRRALKIESQLYDYALLRLEKGVSEEHFKTFIPLAYDFG